MKTEAFLNARATLKKELADFTETVDQKYTKIHAKFIEGNSPLKTKMVYELTKNGIKRRGFKRYVIYTQNVEVISKNVIITCGGWWLNEKSIPTKWDTFSVFGVYNKAEFKLSEDQHTEKHPDLF